MKFLYKARTKEGKIRRGVIEAVSRSAGLGILEKYGLFVTSLTESRKGNFLTKGFVLRRVSHKDIVFFTRQFSVMLKSAIPPVESLRSQVMQTTNPDLREKILKMAERVETGGTLSQAFAQFPKVFDSFFVSIIKTGEATGKVADSLQYLADHLEQEYNLRQKIKGAMIYPVFVSIAFIGAFFLATFFIIPKLTEILTSFSGKLPISTRMMMWLSSFVRKGGWVAILGILGALVFTPFYAGRSKRFKGPYNKIILKTPILGEFNKKIQLTRFAENLSVLIAAGLPITQALKITEDIIQNNVYKKIIKEAGAKVSRGEKLSEVFMKYPKQVPAFVTQMVATGEKSGRLGENLQDIVNFYQKEIERTTDNMTSILEPVMLLVMGVGVAIFAVSIFIPLFKIGMGGM